MKKLQGDLLNLNKRRRIMINKYKSELMKITRKVNQEVWWKVWWMEIEQKWDEKKYNDHKYGEWWKCKNTFDRYRETSKENAIKKFWTQ